MLLCLVFQASHHVHIHVSPSLCFFQGFASCPVVTAPGYNCTTSNNCTEMVCHTNSSTLIGTTTSITVKRCADPPEIYLQTHGLLLLPGNATIFDRSGTFQESVSLSLGGGVDIKVNVQRNWTALVFSVSFSLTLISI